MLGTVGDMGTHVPVWDIADKFGEDTDLAVSDMERARDLAQRLGGHRVVLRRGVGFVATGRTLNDAVKTSVYIPKNARSLAQSLEFGDRSRPISQGEVNARLAIDPEVERHAPRLGILGARGRLRGGCSCPKRAR